MKVASRDQPILPRNRAFVVQFHAEANLEKGKITGRVEHVQSGEAAEFTSVEHLMNFMTRIVGSLL